MNSRIFISTNNSRELLVILVHPWVFMELTDTFNIARDFFAIAENSPKYLSFLLYLGDLKDVVPVSSVHSCKMLASCASVCIVQRTL